MSFSFCGDESVMVMVLVLGWSYEVSSHFRVLSSLISASLSANACFTDKAFFERSTVAWKLCFSLIRAGKLSISTEGK